MKKEQRQFKIGSLMALVLFGAENLVIPAMILILIVLLGGRKMLCI